MSENIKAEVLDDKELSIAEQEASVQKPPPTNEDGDYTVNLGKEPEPEVVEEKQPEAEVQEKQEEEPVLEEIIEDEKDNADEEGLAGSTEVADTAPESKEVLQEEKTQEPKVDLPEGIQELVKFMEETGGSIEDFSRLNADYSDLGSKLAPEQQKAIEFFDRYSKEQQSADELLAQQTKHFQQETGKVFNEEFKGFNFDVGDKKYRFNVKDANKVKETQGDLLNVFNKYVGDNNMLQDAPGYHKALFAASNPDKIANHFYEQGKADAVKQLTADAKNINMDPRKTSSGYVEAGGIKVKAISGDDNSKLKFKLKNY